MFRSFADFFSNWQPFLRSRGKNTVPRSGRRHWVRPVLETLEDRMVLSGYPLRIGSTLEDIAYAVAADQVGNAYVAGSFTGSVDFGAGAATTLTSVAGSKDAFVAKFSPKGSVLWAVGLGGSNTDVAYAIAVDAGGNVFVGGDTSSTNFRTLNPLQTSNTGAADGFVAKLDPSGTLLYSTYLGGGGIEHLAGLAVDANGAAYVTGSTGSGNFPTVTPFQQSNRGGATDAFVAKINPAGNALVYSTYLGRSGNDTGDAIAVDASGNAYVTGATRSSDFPTVNPLQPSLSGSADGFVAKFNATGSALVYSTFLGGRDPVGEGLNGIAVDAQGNAYVVGGGNSPDYPTVHAFQPNLGGGGDVYLSKLNPSGSAFVYSTYLGGNGDETGLGVAVDNAGDVYVTGYTDSGTFPVTNGSTNQSGKDAFALEMNPSGTALVYSTYLGGSGEDIGRSIAVGGAGRIYVGGDFTGSGDFGVSPSVQTLTSLGSSDAFVWSNSTGSSNTPANLTATSGSGQTATVNTAFASPLVVTVTDASSHPVSGASVTFVAPTTGASASFTDGPTGVTGSDGRVSKLLTANGTTGTYSVTAIASGVATQANFTMTNSVAATNTRPSASVWLSTVTPRTKDKVTANAAKYDADADPVSLRFVWKVNGVVKQDHSSSAALTDVFDLSVFGNGDRGQTITVEVTPSDPTGSGDTVVAGAKVVNTPPAITSLAQTKTTPSPLVQPGDTLKVTAGATDDDGDTVALSYVWKVNGVIRGPFPNTPPNALNTFSLQTARARPGDVVTVSVTGKDGSPDGLSATIPAMWKVGSTASSGDSDNNDQISQAIPLGQMTQNRTWPSGTIDTSTDVDMFSFSVVAGQRLAFKATQTSGNLIPYLRLFDGNGNELPADSPRVDSSTEHTFQVAGTYYVGVSGKGNGSYDPVTGTGDTSASTGAYSLSVSAPRSITGFVYGSDLGVGLLSHVEVMLTRVDGGDAPIDPALPTWLLIHGRVSDPTVFSLPASNLVEALEQYDANSHLPSQVLTLDWSQGASDNLLVLAGSRWIDPVAKWAATTLHIQGLQAAQLDEIGHSWGAHVANGIANWFANYLTPGVQSKVNSIVALDPARLPPSLGYSATLMTPFSANSLFSWGFHSSFFGEAAFANTAQESFEVTVGDPSLLGTAHSDVISLFTTMVSQNNAASNAVSRHFSLDRLRTHARDASWVVDPSGAEANVQGTFRFGRWEPLSINYASAGGGQISRYVTNPLAGRSLAGAYNLGSLPGMLTFSNWVGINNQIDYYSFTLTTSGQVHFDLALADPKALVGMTLLTSSGFPYDYSAPGALSPDTYYVLVGATDYNSSYYTLTLTL